MKININSNKIFNLNFIIISFILLYNFYIRYITLKILTDNQKILFIFLFILIIICSFYVRHIKTIITFVFGFSFFLFGFRPYDIQSQIFETLVLFVSIFYLISNLLNNNSEYLNKNLRNLFILLIILSAGSILLLPAKYILYNFLSLGKEWYFYQIVNVHPSSFLYPLNGINKLILFFIFSVIMSQNSFKIFTVLFLGLFFGGVFCALIGLFDNYGIVSLKWYSKTVTPEVLSSTFLNRGWYAEYILLITPFILILLLQNITIIVKYIIFGILILLELTLILAGARSGWVSYPLVLIFCWIFLYCVSEGKIVISRLNLLTIIKIIASIPLTIIISLIILFYIVSHLSGSLTKTTNNQSDNSVNKCTHCLLDQAINIFDSKSRYKVWLQGIDTGLENPLFGLGYDSFAWHARILSKIPESYYGKNTHKYDHYHDTPHNLYIQLFVNGGIAGLTIWLIFFLYSIMLLLYDLISRHNLINIPVIISIIIFHIYGIFQSMQYVSMIWFFIFICIAYCLKISNDVLPQRLKSSTMYINKFVLIIVLFGVSTYFYNIESNHLAKKYLLNKYENDQDYDQYMGFYPKENWSGVNYRWTGRNAKIKLNYKGGIEFKLQYHNVRPDLDPLEIEMSVDGNIVDTIIFTEKTNVVIKDVVLDLGDSLKDKVLGLSISRTWSPKKYGINDDRVLGVAVSEIKPNNI